MTGYTSILGGVSEQVASKRLDGQCSQQINLTCDTVRGLRKRPASQWLGNAHCTNSSISTADALASTTITLGDLNLGVSVNTESGAVLAYSPSSGLLSVTGSYSSYLTAASQDSIRYAQLGPELYILNTEQVPVATPHTTAAVSLPSANGWVWIKQGAYSTTYTVTVTKTTVLVSDGSSPQEDSYILTYTTPDGSSAAHVAQTTPEAIAQGLVDYLLAHLPAFEYGFYKEGAYILFQSWEDGTAPARRVTKTKVTLDSGTIYMGGSGTSCALSSVSELPAKLPVQAFDIIATVGTSPALVYYTYTSSGIWAECAAPNSSSVITNGPLRLRNVSGTLTLDQPALVGRVVGDLLTNPMPDFLDYGLSCIHTFQGRLCYLSKSGSVTMSQSNKPQSCMRLSVASLADTDCISISSTSSVSGGFTQVIDYAGDLLLFSKLAQGGISGRSVLTPRNATIRVFSNLAYDVTAKPVPALGAVLVPYARSALSMGMLLSERNADASSDVAFNFNSLTDHLPTYIAGRALSICVAPADDIALVRTDDDLKKVYVYEYAVRAGEISKNAWGYWLFPFKVQAVHYINGAIYLATSESTVTSSGVPYNLRYLKMELNRGPASSYAGGFLPCADELVSYTVQGTADAPYVTLPANSCIDTTVNLSDLYAVLDLAESRVQVTDVVGTSVYIDNGYGASAIGSQLWLSNAPISSVYEPTLPTPRGRSGEYLDYSRVTLKSYTLTLHNTAEYSVSAEARGVSLDNADAAQVLTWEYIGLGSFSSVVPSESRAIVPLRIDARSGRVIFISSSVFDWNVSHIDYELKSNRRSGRI